MNAHPRGLPVAGGCSTIPRGSERRWHTLLSLALVLLGAACARQPAPGRIEPGVEQRALAGTRPSTHRLVVFRWTLREGQSRFTGAGAARIAPDDRARLDLFGPQDVPYLSAILRGDRLALPAGVPARAVPPPTLLWSALGVIRPPAGAALTNATETADGTTLAYSADDGEWTFRLLDGALVGSEWRSDGGARHTVELSGARSGAQPERALYRDWQEYRELILELEEQEDVDAFPPETWILESR